MIICKRVVLVIAFAFYTSVGNALIIQQQAVTGTFTNANRTITLQLKPVENEYHGMMTSAAGTFVMQAQEENGGLTGKIYGAQAVSDFKIQMSPGQLTFTASGYQEIFYHISYQHSLHEVDLSAYFRSSQPVTTPQGDFDHSYSHTHNQATEKITRSPSVDLTHTVEGLNKDHFLYPYIAGSQLAHFRGTSIFNSSRASSLTYVNFCPNGTFTRTYDGSFTIASTHGSNNDINAAGASYGRNSGTWNILEDNGQPMVKLFFSDGRTDFYRVSKEWAEAGSWRIGNDKYAIQRGKVTCN
ncbi:MAG: hypothetical protein MJA30_35775 [Cytophagales bacterium]|nr:hypothetical protein [Cytophagales bacterium]